MTMTKKTDYRVQLAIYGTAALLLLPVVMTGKVQAQESKSGDPPSVSDPAAQIAAMAKPEEYVIGPDDLLNVYILDVPELSRDYRVSSAGTIAIPVLAHPLDATGLTLAQFSDLLSREL